LEVEQIEDKAADKWISAENTLEEIQEMIGTKFKATFEKELTSEIQEHLDMLTLMRDKHKAQEAVLQNFNITQNMPKVSPKLNEKKLGMIRKFKSSPRVSPAKLLSEE
jgi:hypothetical protein